MPKTGLLIANLGTPDAPTPEALRAYLAEFLMDPYVIDVPWPVRWPLVHWGIVPSRSQASAKLYQNIWSDLGSPLLAHSRKFLAKLANKLPDYTLELGMRYGKPSLAEAFSKLMASQVDTISIFPMYPQYARSSTLTCLKACAKAVHKLGFNGLVTYYPEFFDASPYQDALAKTVAEVLEHQKPDFLLYSYHGLPEHHLTVDSKGCQFTEGCCLNFRTHHPHCYRAQCIATTAQVQNRLKGFGVPHSIAYQSRLGRRPWLKPNTEHVIADLARQGIKKLAVACPSFTSDCLETLEEISFRAQEVFVAHGGKEVILVPSLNDRDDWVDAVANLVRQMRPLSLAMS